MEQRSDEWFKARLGKVTASRISDVMAKTKTGYGAARAKYMSELVTERLSGRPALSFTSPAMAWGIENEDAARAAYEALEGTLVEKAFFVPHPDIPNCGASPDGYVGEKGLVEIKCPLSSTHTSYLLTEEVPKDYLLQMQWQMACTKREWCDFVSFDPRMPERFQLFIKRVSFDLGLVNEIVDEVEIFLDELETTIQKLNELYKGF
jgi:putative phage-type endonuclease